MTDYGIEYAPETTADKQPASVGQILFASLLGLSGIAFVAATLAIDPTKKARLAKQNPSPPYTPLSPAHASVRSQVDVMARRLSGWEAIKGKTIQGDAIWAKRTGSDVYELRVGGTTYQMPLPWDVAAQFVALDASILPKPSSKRIKTVRRKAA